MNKKISLVFALLCLLILLVFIQTLQAQEIKASLRAIPSHYTGKCPATIQFQGLISVRKAGKVQYKFIRSDGAHAPVHTLAFPKPGGKKVSADWTIGKDYDGWMAIEVMYPEHVVSNKANFRIRCSDSGKLPDLAIDNIFLTKDNRVAVMVKNIGPGQVPDEVWTVHKPDSSGVYLYIDGRRWGGASIWLFDPGRSLKPTGGKATYISNLKISGTVRITATVDETRQVNETNEGNNKMTKRLSAK